MSVTLYQPTLPPESDVTEAEVDFIESSPPGLFPDNQDSNFGFVIRKTWTDRYQELIQQLDTIYAERFVASSTQFLDEWEREAGVPVAPAGLDVATRQAIVTGRIRKGPFTRTMRRSIIEDYIGATFGTPVIFDSSGVAMSGSGVPLYAGAGTTQQMYEVVEDVQNFLYHVYIENTVAPATGMLRELTRATPAGISFDVTYVASAAPRLYWKLNEPAGSASVADYSQFAHPATTVSGITLGGYAATGDLQPAALFPSGSGFIRGAYAPFVVNSTRTFEGWAWRNSSTGQNVIFQDQAAAGPIFYLASGSQDAVFRTTGSNPQTWTAAWPGNAQWVHWALTYNDSTKIAELFINGVSKGTKTMSAAYAAGATNFQLGISSAINFNGYMRDVAIYERILPLAEIQSYAHGFTLP